jgi:hypothetical protein
MLLVIALLHLVLGAFVFIMHISDDVSPADDAARAVATATLVINSIIGLAMLAFFAGSKRAPAAAITGATLTWMGVNLLAAILSPLTILSFLLFKLSMLVLLAVGAVSALRARSLLRKLSAEAG